MQPLSVCHAGLDAPRLQPEPASDQADSVNSRALATPLALAGSSVVPPAAVTSGSAAGKSFVDVPG